MSAVALRILTLAALPERLEAVLAASPCGPFAIVACDDPVRFEAALAAGGFDALLLDPSGSERAEALVGSAGRDTALLVCGSTGDAETMLTWLQRGAQDVLAPHDLLAPSLGWRLRAAVERKRCEREARKAYSTDLETGLPHQQQLIEHMSHLLALREREPAPMAMLVLRIEGLSTAAQRHGPALASVLRRKLAVRLRAGVRTSDVVAALETDSFAVLLASILTPADADRVGAKLLKALHLPIKITGHDVAVAVAIGISLYPQDGTQPDALLRRAAGLAASTTAVGRVGLSNAVESGGRLPEAANDA